MVASISAAFLIIPSEGSITNKQGMHVAYKDPVGIVTYCYGETGKTLTGRTVKVGDVFTEGECIALLAKRLKQFESQVNRVVKVSYASPYQEAALISFTYNVGIGNLSSSTALRKLNAGDYLGACEHLTDWVYAKKIKLKGLVVRREKEMQWCLGNAPYSAQQLYIELAQASLIKD